jgi:putative DNA primase/helicase
VASLLDSFPVKKFDRVDTRGRWHGILTSLGMSASHLSKKHGPCPFCGGKDRFRFLDTNGSGTWICNQCGHGDGFALVKRFRNVEFREALDLIRPLVDGLPQQASSNRSARPGAPTAEQKQQREAIWAMGRPVHADDAVSRYLKYRLAPIYRRTGGPPLRSMTQELRTVLCDDGAIMLARVQSPSGAEITLHRTYLTLEGRLVDAMQSRKMMPGPVPAGGAVRLLPVDERKPLGIAEGIETALSAALLFGVPCWAALNAGGMSSWKCPSEVSEVWIFGDNDSNGIGQKAADRLRQRCEAAATPAKVYIPQAPDTDWNDPVNAKG